MRPLRLRPQPTVDIHAPGNPGPYDYGKASRTVFAMKMPNHITAKDLYPVFSKFGAINFVAAMPAKEKSKKVYAFVIYHKDESAQLAAKEGWFELQGKKYKCIVSKLDYSARKHKEDQSRRMKSQILIQQRKEIKRQIKFSQKVLAGRGRGRIPFCGNPVLQRWRPGVSSGYFESWGSLRRNAVRRGYGPSGRVAARRSPFLSSKTAEWNNSGNRAANRMRASSYLSDGRGSGRGRDGYQGRGWRYGHT